MTRRRLLLGTVYAAFLLGLVEAGSRAFWSIRYRMPADPAHHLHAFYPGLATAERGTGGDTLDILLLGGSVMTKAFGSIDEGLNERMALALRRPVRIYNLAQSGQTSRDSYLKYRHLAGASFDAVFVYNGINEIRFNAAPADLFAGDYSHVPWYRTVNAFVDGGFELWSTPRTIGHFATKAGERFGWIPSATWDEPEAEKFEYARTIKTGPAFRANLRGMAELAASRGEPLIIGTFAHYIPEDYSREAFHAGRLDYARHLMEVEEWGTPATVTATLDVHNAAARDVAAEFPTVSLVDFAVDMPTGGTHFNDLCHLTHAGSQAFVDLLLPVVLGAIGRS